VGAVNLVTAAVLVFGGLGGSLFALGYLLMPPRVDIAVLVARYDAAQVDPHRRSRPVGTTPGQTPGEGRLRIGRARLGGWLAHELDTRGFSIGVRRSDLELLGRRWEVFLGTKVLTGLYGALLLPAAAAVAGLYGAPLPLALPLAAVPVLGAVFFVLPDVDVRRLAAARRRDFTRALGAFLDLVAMSLAGGRGMPEALPVAARVGEGWAFTLLADTISTARLSGQTPWEALGELGERIGVPELSDLAGSLTLVAEDGAKIRESITARAGTLRRRQLADAEGKAGEADQGMLAAQVVLALGFLALLMYPATYNVITF
jgi:tight adherence protein C